MENLLKTVGEKLRLIRQNRSLTQENVAELLNLSHSAYAKIERGETDMTIKRLEEVAQIFGVTAIEILQLGDGHQQSNNQNNNYSLINNSTISIPINPEEIKNLFKQIETLNLSIQRIVKRLDVIEKK